MAEDLDWIVSSARQQDASLDHVLAEQLATSALPLARGLDAPAVARALMERYPDVGVSEINAVARATVEYLEAQ